MPKRIKNLPRPDHGLLHDVRPPPGQHHRIINLEIGINENPIVRHLHVVEYDEGILLVKAARQWKIERITDPGKTIPTEEPKARRIHRDRERKRMLIGRARHRMPRVDRQLVGKRRQRRQNPRPTYDHSILGISDLVHRDVLVFVARDGSFAFSLIGRGVNDGMREADVLARKLLLEVDQTRRAPLVAADRPLVSQRPANPAKVTFI